MHLIRHKAAILIGAVLAALLWAGTGAAQEPLRDPQRAIMDRGPAALLAEGATAPGSELDLALLFQPDAGWHGYWANPGDAGLGLTLEWELPPGWQAGQPLYPVPQRYILMGIMNHVFEGEHAVLVPLSVPADAQAGRSYPIAVFARWLTCNDELCVPQQARLTATVTLGAAAGPDPRFEAWRAAIPPMIDSKARFQITPSALKIAIPLPATLSVSSPHVFIEQGQIADYNAPQTFRRQGDMLVAEVARGGLRQEAEQISGIITLDGSATGLRFVAEPGEVPAGGELIAGGRMMAPLWLLLGGALLGGLLLNLMPCVFPILSLKALTLARAGESAGGARREGLAYTAGVVLACTALGGLLLALRAGGNEIGWAFQLQEPGVVAALLVLAALITANFAGVYELPSLSITRSGGRASAFSTGLLAAFVATPCTGPFMAAALGAALLLPWDQALLLFAVLGLGLALPFLLLGFVPALRRILPKPGPWMNTFRKVMAVPMGLTALALLWLTWRLGGTWFAVLAAIAAAQIIIVLAAWRAGQARRAVVAGVIALTAIMFLPRNFSPPISTVQSVLEPRDFSFDALADARASGQPVFLWFTADWCLTCKVNERVAIEREATRAAFAAAGVIAMRGDWTRNDPEITRFLTEQGAAGVPLYLWYPAGAEAEQLPQVLTQGSLVALARQD